MYPENPMNENADPYENLGGSFLEMCVHMFSGSNFPDPTTPTRGLAGWLGLLNQQTG